MSHTDLGQRGTLLLWAALRIAWDPTGEVKKITAAMMRTFRLEMGFEAPRKRARPKTVTTAPPITLTVAACIRV